MKILLPLVFLACVFSLPISPQEPPQSPRETKESNAPSKQKKAKGRGESGHPLGATYTEPTIETPRPKESGNNPGRADRRETTIDIRSVPRLSVDAVKDWTDRSYWLFSGLLVIVGGFQAWLLYRTWQATRRYAVAAEETKDATDRNAVAAKANADAAKAAADAASRQVALMEESLESTRTAAMAALKSADVARASADALINSERAWLVVTPRQRPRPLDPRLRDLSFFEFDLRNCGRTPARLTGPFQHNFRLVSAGEDLPPDLDFGHPEDYWAGSVGGPEYGRLLTPGEENGTLQFPFWKMTTEDIAAVADHTRRLFFYASLRYFDFADKERELRFCYEYIPETESKNERWILGGPPEYHKHT